MVINNKKAMKAGLGEIGGQIFRLKGYRLTRSRQIILKVLRKSRGHLTAGQICRQAAREYPAINLATVYRNLEVLRKMKSVAKFDFGHGRAKYELAEEFRNIGHHHHLVCCQCTRIIDYTDFMDEEMRLLKIAQRGLAKKYNFQIQHHVIQFRGICRDCRRARKR